MPSSTPSPFPGFPPEGLAFLVDLDSHNDRAWFEPRKADYARLVQTPAVAFVEALGAHLARISDVTVDTRLNGSGTLLRPYRDTRFGDDKRPYKTNVSGLFWDGVGKKMGRPAFGFQLEPGQMRLMAGVFRFSPETLEAYREAVADDDAGAELNAIVADLVAAGYRIEGQHYQRVPRGYDPEHPRGALLRHAGLYAHPEPLAGEILTSPELVEACFEHYAAMAPLRAWLVGVERRSQASSR